MGLDLENRRAVLLRVPAVDVAARVRRAVKLTEEDRRGKQCSSSPPRRSRSRFGALTWAFEHAALLELPLHVFHDAVAKGDEPVLVAPVRLVHDLTDAVVSLGSPHASA